MYICMECGATFSEPAVWYEHHGLDAPPYERWLGSPCCHYDFEEAFECRQCGAIMPESHNEYKICDKCKQKSIDHFRYLLCNEFSEAERRYIDPFVEKFGIINPEDIREISL